MKLTLITAVAALLLATGSASFGEYDRDAIFYDDFSRLDPDWGDTNDVLRSENKQLILVPEVNNGYTALLRTPFGDADIRATFSLAPGGVAEPAGIAFWSGGLDNYYVAAMNPNGTFAIFRLVNHRWLFPVSWQKSDAIKQGFGQANELRVVTQGNLATFYINDQQVTATHGFPPAGRSQIGLHAESGDSRNRWEFTEYKVLKAPPPASPVVADSDTLFADDFATLDPSWGTASDVERVEGGKLILQPPVNEGRYFLNQGAVFGDADIRVTMSASNADQYVGQGLLFWASDTSNFYVCMIETDGTFGVSRSVGGKSADVALWKVNEAVKQGANQSNTLRVVTQGETATCYVNDQQVAKFKGYPPGSGGQIGLYAESGTDPCRFEFSGFKVLKAPADDSSSSGADSLIFSDNFSTLDPSWGESGNLSRVDNNKLIMQLPANGIHILAYNGARIGDANIRVKVSLTQGVADQPAAIAFWCTPDASSYYMAEVSTNGMFAIHRWLNGRWLLACPWQQSDAIKQGLGQINELRVVMQGNVATFSINDRQVVSIKGYPVDGGSRFGLLAESGNQPSTWEFSEFKVLQAPAGNPASNSPADGNTLFADDFATLDAAWGLAGPNQRVDGNKLVLQAQANGTYTTLNQGNLFSDSDVRAKLSLAQGGTDEPGGIAFWGSDGDSYYAALMQPAGLIAIVRRTRNQWLFPVNWQKSDAVKQGLGQTNELRLVTQGNLATFYINGQQVTAIHGFPPSGGSLVGLHAESGATAYTWQFSEFQVLKAPAGGPAAAGSDASLLLTDDFATLDPAWGPADDVVNVDGNKLVIRPQANQICHAFYQGSLFDDVDIRVNVSQAQGAVDQPASIAFWIDDAANNYYVALLQIDGYFAIQRMQNHRWLVLRNWQPSDAIKQGQGQTNELRVVTQGNMATFYINGQQVTAIHGFPPSGGSKLGLCAQSNATVSTWQFSDFELRTAPAGNPAATGGADSSVIFADDFSTLDPAWSVNEMMHVEGNKLIIVPRPGGELENLYQGNLFDDVEIRVTISQAQGDTGDEAGLLFWGSDINDFYGAGIMSSGAYYVQRIANNKSLMPIPVQNSDAIHKGLGQTNDLRLVLKGRSATLFVNDKQVAQFNGFPPSGGSLLGLHSSSGKDQASTWEFSNFSVRKAP